ncbi:MAG: hypothetical protein WBQ26_13690 [Gemmatimonadaceae bacterium]|nr:hypothetical protein [Gemmatimonadaceae bacterium]
MRSGWLGAALVAAVMSSGCATGMRGTRAPAAAPAPVWPVVTREHVDLWLHGYAMITRDAAQVPVFRRGYRNSLDVLRRKDNVLTGLDANHERLATLMAQNAEITNGQFLPLYFDSWDEMVQTINAFLGADGDARTAPPALRVQVALVASMFPTAQDREWLRLFTQSLGDESEHFFHQYWVSQQEACKPLVVAVDSLWQSLRPRFQSFLTNTHQLDGQLVLSLVIGGEGRTLNASPQHNVMVVALPESRADLDDPIYGFAHEAVQSIANSAIIDNTTAAEQRSGVAAGYAPTAAVRAGAMLMDRAAPEFADGFMRFYLRQAGVTPPPGNVEATFVATFPLPTAIEASMDRQINTALGGI